MKSIIYDWDGTLCNSIQDSFEAMCRVFERCGKPRPTMKKYVSRMRQPATAFYRDCGIGPGITDEQIWKWYLEEANHHDNALFGDVIPALIRQRTNGFKISLVTVQRAKMLNQLLKKLGCDWLFDHVFPGADSGKTSLFIEACRRMETSPRETYCVGDFKSDIIQAKEARLIPVAIVRNRHRGIHSVFKKASAVLTVSDLYSLNKHIIV